MPATYALTVYQPYCSLIMAGLKPLEFRSWDFMERGFSHLIGERIVIHASARSVREEAIDEATGQFAAHARANPNIITYAQWRTAEKLLRHWRDNPHKLTLAAALGTAIIEAPIRPRGWHNFGWPMKEPQAFDKPIPAKGAQGFWVWTPEPAPDGHACRAIGCTAIIPCDRRFCFRHWVIIPRAMQREISRTYDTDNGAYLMAIKSAREEIAEFEGIKLEEAAQ